MAQANASSAPMPKNWCRIVMEAGRREAPCTVQQVAGRGKGRARGGLEGFNG
jgi:hypothetical protein